MNRIPDTGSNRSSVSEHSHQGFPVLLWGGKTKARIVDEMLRESGIGRIELIFDSTIDVLPFQTEATFTNDIQVLKKQIHKVSHYVVCMGGEHGYARFHAAKYLERAGLKPVTLIHHRSFVEPTSKVGTGCHIMPGAVVHKFADIGEQTIVNTSATIDHECLIGKGVHIMGNASLAGKVTVGDFATIGTNATILPFVQIGEGAFVGAGAVVTKDVPPYSVVVGVPARHLRTIEPEFSTNLFEELLR